MFNSSLAALILHAVLREVLPEVLPEGFDNLNFFVVVFSRQCFR